MPRATREPLARAFAYENTVLSHRAAARHRRRSTPRASAATTSSSRATCSSTSRRRCRARSTTRSRMLKPGGKLIFTVPFTLDRGHARALSRAARMVASQRADGAWTLTNRTRDGRVQTLRPTSCSTAGPARRSRCACSRATRSMREFAARGLHRACASPTSPTCRSASTGPSRGRCRSSPRRREPRQASGDQRGPRAARARRRVHRPPLRLRGARRHRGVGARARRARAPGRQDAGHGGRRAASR